MALRIGKLVVVGVGLIGGSFALALRRAAAVDIVVGIGRSQANLDEAVARGIVDRAYRLDAAWTQEVADADVVLVATPVAQFATLFAKLAGAVGPATIVTDAGSTKADALRAAAATFGPQGNLARFVPGHPIAGTEHTGAAAAFPALFNDRAVILTPTATTAATATAAITQLWQRCGARVQTLDAARHDAVFAAVSHLPHVLAFALVADLAQRPDAAMYFAHAASGFRDFTRIAGSSPEMWRDVALANSSALLAEIDRYGAVLATIRAAIDAGEGEVLQTLFAQASTARRTWETQRLRDSAGADAEPL